MTLCDACHDKMTSRIASVEQPYHYTLSGLPNVWLAGISVFCCQRCNVELPVIPKPGELHRVIVRSVIEKSERLTGQEIRLLRQFAGKLAKDFAASLRITASALSRIENGEEPGPQTDALARAVAATVLGHKEAERVLLEPGAQSDQPSWDCVVFGQSRGGWKALKKAA